MPGVLSQMLLSSTAPAAPAPTVVQRTGGGTAGRTTSNVLTWAAVTAGNYIVIEYVCETNGAAPTTPAGYTLWPAGNSNNSSYTLSVFYKVAAGGETGVTISQGNNGAAWNMREISGAAGIDFGTPVTSTGSTNPDPPAVAVTGGPKPVLAVAGEGCATASVSAYSSGYGNGFENKSTTNVFGIASAEWTTTTSSEDAAAMTINSSVRNTAFSYALR